MIWSTVKRAFMLHSSEICVSTRYDKVRYVENFGESTTYLVWNTHYGTVFKQCAHRIWLTWNAFVDVGLAVAASGQKSRQHRQEWAIPIPILEKGLPKIVFVVTGFLASWSALKYKLGLQNFKASKLSWGEEKSNWKISDFSSASLTGQ